jgi:hypothetical protein
MVARSGAPFYRSRLCTSSRIGRLDYFFPKNVQEANTLILYSRVAYREHTFLENIMEPNVALPVVAGKKPIAMELEPGQYHWCTCGLSTTFCDGARSEI